MRLPLALLLLVCTVAGCGGTGDVSGKVTYKGKPVVSGAVLLMTSDQLPHYGQLQNDGSFSILGLPKGEARIAVNSPDPKALYAPASTKFGKKQSAPPLSLPEASKWFPLPAKVGDPHSSGLKLTVHGGVNVLNLELKDE